LTDLLPISFLVHVHGSYRWASFYTLWLKWLFPYNEVPFRG